MVVRFNWSENTRHWLDGLSEMADRTIFNMGRHLNHAALDLVPRMRASMPVFEGDMRDNFTWSWSERGPNAVSIRFEFPGDLTVMDPVESVDHSTAPFHYPWGKHDGIQPHAVLIYNPRTGRGRAKLIRWAQSKGIISDAVPADGSREEIEAARGDSPALLHVAPEHTNFIEEHLYEYAPLMLEHMGEALGVAWRA